MAEPIRGEIKITVSEPARKPSPLEAGEPQPVWLGTEEDKLAPLDEDKYYNTSTVLMPDGSYRHVSVAYEKYLHEDLVWQIKYTDYNGRSKRFKEQQEKRNIENKYYKFCLGEEGQKKFDDFIKKYRNYENKSGMYPPGAYYVFIIHPTYLGDVVTCEVRQSDKYGDETIIDSCEVYNEI